MYIEEQVWTLCGSTGCYTVPPVDFPSTNADPSLRFATHHHICHVSSNGKWRCDSLSADHAVCLGYHWASLSEETVVEAVVLLLPFQNGSSSSERSQTLDSPPKTVPHHTRLFSTPTAPSLSEQDATEKDAKEDRSAPAKPVAELLVRFRHQESDEAPPTCIRQTVDFRPLAVHVTVLSSSVFVWCGSADSNTLYCFLVQKDNGRMIPLLDHSNKDEAAFVFPSPIMALQTKLLSTNNGLCLVAAGQDGTVRLLTMDYDDADSPSFRNPQSLEWIVDGPIVCLQLLEDDQTNKMQVWLGSLCGYVAHVAVNTDAMECVTQPTMLVEQLLWNTKLQSEDSVLALHRSQLLVALGTQSGRVLVYQEGHNDAKDKKENDYQLMWHAVLPYPVYRVSIQPISKQLWVVTRKSVHVFAIDHLQSQIAKEEAAQIKKKLQEVLSLERLKNISEKEARPTGGAPESTITMTSNEAK